MRLSSRAAVMALAGLVLVSVATAQDKSKAKGNDKGDAITKKVAVELQKLFKIWDGNKDGFADQAELAKFATSAKPKTGKKPAKDDADPGAEAMTALLAKLDQDQDQKFSQAEFETWVGTFARDLTEIGRLQAEAARVQLELTKLQELSKRSGNVTAGDGIFQDAARKGIIQYQQQLDELNGRIEKIQTDGGHAGYRQFLQAELMKRIKL